MDGERDRSRPPAGPANGTARFDAVQERHCQIENGNVGGQLAGKAGRLAPVRGLRHDLESLAFQERSDSLADDDVVVGEKNPAAYDRRKGTDASSSVPPPGRDMRSS